MIDRNTTAVIVTALYLAGGSSAVAALTGLVGDASGVDIGQYSTLGLVCFVLAGMRRRELARHNQQPPVAVDADELSAQVAHAAAHIAEALVPISEAAAGQRRRLVDEGWSESAAEQMSLAYYVTTLSALSQSGGHPHAGH